MNSQLPHHPPPSLQHVRVSKQLALMVIVSAVIMIVYKSASKAVSPIKTLLFINSLVINDLSLRYAFLGFNSDLLL